MSKSTKPSKVCANSTATRTARSAPTNSVQSVRTATRNAKADVPTINAATAEIAHRHKPPRTNTDPDPSNGSASKADNGSTDSTAALSRKWDNANRCSVLTSMDAAITNRCKASRSRHAATSSNAGQCSTDSIAARSHKWDNAHQCNVLTSAGPAVTNRCKASRSHRAATSNSVGRCSTDNIAALSHKWASASRCNVLTFADPAITTRCKASRSHRAATSSNANRCSTDNIAARSHRNKTASRTKIMEITRNHQRLRSMGRMARDHANTVSTAELRPHPRLRSDRSKASGYY